MFKEKQQIEIMNDTAFLVTVIIFPKHDHFFEDHCKN